MNSWKLRLRKYNRENNIVQVQTGGDPLKIYNIPDINDTYYNNIVLDNVSYSLNDKKTVQLIKQIINYYNKKY